ncbi:hypothetical protein VP1G_04047 [Cytospora mali]|uniref:Cytochrome P450 n=1 Tax=Cytospora mali TaxID=578113 RepID=A0A194UYC8_CYTMA|nr:hypothetical protein VP1G_04047 [Valsa mali var. pyri (nom. inval.)]
MARHAFAASVFAVAFGLTSSRLFWVAVSPRTAASWTSYAGIGLTALLDWIFLVLVYRLTLHPLAKYPGPLLAACTDWYNVYWVANGSRHLDFDRQHKKYGAIVRFGPNRISFCSAGASRDLGSVKANVLRSPVFSAFKRFFGVDSSATTLNPKEHAFRRRVNNQALTPGILQAYEGRVTPHIAYMVELLKKDLDSVPENAQGKGEKEGWGSAYNMTRTLMYCVADIMADLVFNQPWNVQRDPRNRRHIEQLSKSTTGLLVAGHMQTVFRLGLHWILFFPFMKDVIHFLLLAKSFATRRASQTDSDFKLAKGQRDIWSALLASKDAETGQGFTPDQLTSEAGMFVTAGTGTSITTTSATLFYILHNPHTLARLTREIRTAFPVPDDCTGQPASQLACPIEWGSPELRKISYLEACILEALRLSPGLPGISPRVAGPGGITLDGAWFPEGTELGIPFWSLYRMSEYFDEPLVYKPERWLPVEEGGMGLQPGLGPAAAFTPFGQGRFGCLGRHLAMQEITLILGRLIWLFDMRLEPGNNLGGGTGEAQEGRECPSEFQILDRFASDGNGPSVQFRYRAP